MKEIPQYSFKTYDSLSGRKFQLFVESLKAEQTTVCELSIVVNPGSGGGLDGVSVVFLEGWGLVRASNTQPVLVARCEAKTPEGLRKICSIVKEAVARHPEVGVFDWECYG
ncbi:MAG: hypothetical protein AB1445_13070 [Bacillota bacterium]